MNSRVAKSFSRVWRNTSAMSGSSLKPHGRPSAYSMSAVLKPRAKASDLRGDDVAQAEVVLKRGTVVERGGGIDGPGLLGLRIGFPAGIGRHVAVLRPPLADGVEILQAEADGVDLAMAARALRILLMRLHPLAGGEHLAREAGERRDIRRRGRRRIVEELAQDPRAAFDRAGVLAVAAHEMNGRHPQQSAARRVLGQRRLFGRRRPSRRRGRSSSRARY